VLRRRVDPQDLACAVGIETGPAARVVLRLVDLRCLRVGEHAGTRLAVHEHGQPTERGGLDRLYHQLGEALQGFDHGRVADEELRNLSETVVNSFWRSSHIVTPWGYPLLTTVERTSGRLCPQTVP
jgi:hypothetical protein